MSSLPARLALLAACLTLRLAAADSPASSQESAANPTPSSALDDQKKLEDAIRARLAEHALKKTTMEATVTPAATQPGADVTGTTAAAAPAKDAGTPPVKPADDPTTLLPRVEVNQSRITALAVKQHEMDVQIAREKKNTKPSELDNNLNDPGVSHALSLFGGSSSEDRARLAQERVSLLEAERDLIDQIAQSRTEDERKELQKQLDDLKTMRRELERAPKDTRSE